MPPRKTTLPSKIERNTPQTKSANNYTEEKPPSRWWGNPFLKGFMYTAGAALAGAPTNGVDFIKFKFAG